MKLRMITAAKSDAVPVKILDFFREWVSDQIRETVHGSHPHWVEADDVPPNGSRRQMVLKWSNILAGLLRSHNGRMCPHRLELSRWDCGTSAEYIEILQDPWAVWGLAALRQCDR